MDFLVGIDLGTTACKVTVVADDLTANTLTSAPYPISAPHRGWAEQDPLAWGEAVDSTVQRALDSAGVVRHDELLPFCRELAADICSADQAAVAALFDTYNRVAGEAMGAGWEQEREGAMRWMQTAGFDPSRVAERRDAIISRGSSQI